MGEHRESSKPPLVKVIGRPGSALAHAIRDFLQRSDVPFESVQISSDEEARALAGVEHLHDSRLPVCVFADGTRMECPSLRQILEKLGWFKGPSRSEYDLAIYGAGPAGLSAAVYASSDGLKTVLVERWTVGGQAGSTS
ncbi:MAG TPA: FAD-dependent oxidoreductase, partial [Burkholderiales bacterium]